MIIHRDIFHFRKPDIIHKIYTGLSIVSIGVCCIMAAGCSAANSYNKSLDKIISPYTFSTLNWESQNLFTRSVSPADTATVLSYFSQAGQINSAATTDKSLELELSHLSASVEAAITQQIQHVLTNQGLLPAHDYINLTIPPVYFHLTEAPYILAISPRDSISLKNQIMLRNNITDQDIESVEKQVSKLNVSVEIEQLGGYGAIYPTCVSLTSSMQFTIETAVHEWVHQYLAFKPLGLRYILDGLGINKNYDAVTINETVAGIVSQEIAAIIIQDYYPTTSSVQATPTATAFDFNVAMQNIRRQVDTYLAAGQIDLAESYMEEQRQFLATKGYYIRKLNQAYFAFHGIYADSPTSVDPLGDQLRQLRKNSPTLRDFLETISDTVSRQGVVNRLSHTGVNP